MKHVFHLRSNTFIFIVSFEKTCKKKKGGVRASSRFPNTRAFICISVFGTRNEALTFVIDILHQAQVCHTLLHGLLPLNLLVSHYCWG